MVLGYFGRTPVKPDPEIVKIAEKQMGMPVFDGDPLDVLEPGIPNAVKILEKEGLPAGWVYAIPKIFSMQEDSVNKSRISHLVICGSLIVVRNSIQDLRLTPFFVANPYCWGTIGNVRAERSQL